MLFSSSDPSAVILHKRFQPKNAVHGTPSAINLVLPSASSANYYVRHQAAYLGEEVPTVVHASGVASGNLPAATAEQPLCSKTCLLIMGPVAAGLVVAAIIAGIVIVRKRRALTEFKSSAGFTLRKQSTAGQLDRAGFDDLMMEMFEPPELSVSPNPHVSAEWRHASGATAGNTAGRNAMLGLTTIMEENMHDKAREKMYGSLRRKSSHKLAPIRLNSPRLLMRGDNSPFNTPPISPSLSSSVQGSPSLVPFPAGNSVPYHAPIPGPAVNPYLKPAPKKKRKLTIPYNPSDVTRRRSLEGAW